MKGVIYGTHDVELFKTLFHILYVMLWNGTEDEKRALEATEDVSYDYD